MPPSKTRYVTACQQILALGVVLAALTPAASVISLDVVRETPSSGSTGAAQQQPVATLSAYVKAQEKPSVLPAQVVDPTVTEIPLTAPAPTAGAKSATLLAGRLTANARSKPGSLPGSTEVTSVPEPVVGYGAVGVTWEHGAQVPDTQLGFQVRTRTGADWSSWITLPYDAEHAPDPDSAEGRHARPGTDPLLVGEVDQVQVRATSQTGTVPADMKLAVVDPGKATRTVVSRGALDTNTMDGSSAPTQPSALTGSIASDEGRISLSAAAYTPKPVIYSRAQWGADERMRDKSSLHYYEVHAGFVHHTVNANDYTRAEVPGIIRSIYAYHTQSKGWSDIGYNVLVDRFGRVWEGRYGGVDRPVVGAHTLNYNDYSFAMSAIGNFDITQPPQAMLNAYASLFAWKLSLSNIRADATHLWVKDRWLYAINGHRDVGQTACPGRYLYAKIPSVRVAAQAIQNAAQTPVDPVTLPMVPAPAGMPAPTQAPAVAIAQPAITFPAQLNLAGSGWPDLLVKSATGNIQVVPTDGVTDFTTRVASGTTFWNKMNLIAAVGDVTGDGRSDVLARNARTGVTRVYPGNGDGTVGRGTDATKAFAGVSSIVGVRDFNRDHRVDVVGRDRATGSLLLFAGAGNGTFKAPVVLRKKWPFTKVVGVGDFNGDKQPDLVATKDGRTLYLVPGASRGAAVGRPVVIGALPSTANALLGWGDVNGDGHSDVLARTGGLTAAYAGTGTGGLGQSFGPFSSLGSLAKVSMAPMMGSAAADVVGRDGAGHLVVVANNGLRSAKAPLASNLTVAPASQLLDVGDWNRDGIGDVVVRTAGGDQLVLYPGLGNGRFGRPRSLGTGWAPITRLAAVGDVTGDGFPDLLGATASGPMTIFRGAGDNGFSAPVLAPASMRTYNQIGSAPWAPGGAVFASADGTFVPTTGVDPASAMRMANGPAAASYDTYVGVGDVNGDGVADLLARQSGTGTIWLLPGKTSGGFAPRMWVANGFAGYSLVG
ncbi:MAG: FG-GAP-like repeat-containing protein [Nocardioides sp.]